MIGYTCTYSVDTIEYLLDSGFFDSASHRSNLTLAIHELDVHYQHNNVHKERYKYLMDALQRKAAEEKK